MITVHTVRFNVSPNHTEHFEYAVQQMMRALRNTDTTGFRYEVDKSVDGLTFQGILQLNEGVENPLLGLQEGHTFLAGLEKWLSSPPERMQWIQFDESHALKSAGVK